MVNAIAVSLSEMFSNPWQIGVLAYLIIGVIVVGVVSVRGMKLRRPPTNGLLWEQRDNRRNTQPLFLAAGKFHPIGFVIEVLLWPLWLIFILRS